MLPTSPRLCERSMCSSCATPACITATRVSWGVQLMRMSSLMAPILPRPAPAGDSELREHLRGFVQRQAHDAGVAAAQFLDERRGAALHGVGARLVHRLAGVDVALDLV